MINPTSPTIEEILNSSVQLSVPKYQREYTWGKSEAIEFIEDLKSYAESGAGNLFFGTFIFDVSKEEVEQIVKIVDGQQRITTVLLLLIACRNLAKKINETNIANVIQSKITFLDSTTAESKGPKLITSESIREVFNCMTEFEWEGEFPQRAGGKQIKRQVNKVKPIYEFFEDEIKDFSRNDLSNFLKALYNTYIVQIEIRNEEEAFSIFERTNARGVDLEVSDLLKNYLFSAGVDDLEERWSQIINNSDGTVLRMLKYFYVARNGYITKTNLYRKIREYSRSVGVNELVDQLEKFSTFYNVIKNGESKDLQGYFESIGCTSISQDEGKYEKIHIALQGLRLFRVSQVYPLIYSALVCFVNNGYGADLKKSKELIKFFEILEKYHFVNNVICERIGNEVEKLYADFCNDYFEKQDFDNTTYEIISVLKSKLANEDEFVSRFKELSYSQDSIPLICYIFDRLNNISVAPADRIKIFNPDQKLLRRNHNIEHFYPQKPQSIEDTDQELLDVLNNIGNLLVISIQTNSKLSNKLPDEKISLLKGQLSRDVENKSYVQKFIQNYQDKYFSVWNKDSILNRSIELGKEMYSKIFNF